MSQQTTFAGAAWATKGNVTRREQFLREMEAVVPWDRLLALIAPHYHPRGRPGRPAHPLPVMLRIYFLQQWYAFSDPQAEEALYDTETMRASRVSSWGTTGSRTNRPSCVSATCWSGTN
jgi:hypothetical protein